jgi:DNA replication and repair protein RecF
LRFDQVHVEHLRNLNSVDIELNPGLNYFCGPNGAGKTALLESLFVLARGRSFRTQLVRDLVQRGASSLLVRARLRDEGRGAVSVGIRRELSGETELRVDGARVQKVSAIARLIPLQTLLPDVADLVFGAPAGRRSWLDWGLFHVKPDYLVTLRGYLRAVRQRNMLLRRGEPLRSAYAPWDREIVALADQITDARSEYIERLLPFLQETVSTLAPELEATFAYRRGWPEGDSLEKLLGETPLTEVKLPVTQWGPHRADVAVRSRGERASRMLSRGQGKLLATAMKVAQVALLNAVEQRSSVFLIDDIGAELDADHSGRFFELLRRLECQVLATSAQPADDDFGFGPSECQVFHVKQGDISRA